MTGLAHPEQSEHPSSASHSPGASSIAPALVINNDPSPSRPTKRARLRGHDGDKEKRERCIVACNRCKSKKLKCLRADNGQAQCVACIKAAEVCVFEDVANRPVNTRYLLALEARCAQLEQALADINPNHTETADHYVPSRAAAAEALDMGIVRQATNTSTPARDTPPRSVDGERPALPNIRTSFSFLNLFKGSSHRRRPNRPHPTDLGAVMQPSSPTDPSINPNPSLPPTHIADLLVETAYDHIQCRYPFIDWEQLRAWHADRQRLSRADLDSSCEDQIGAFFLWAIYAVGVELVPVTGVDSADSYFDRAWKHLDAVMLPYDLTTIRALLLATFYAFRAPAGPSLWLLAGFAMRICVEMGLHRKTPASHDPLNDQYRKRVFWSAYAFDRLVSHASGRPVSISDSSIDVDFPVDIDTSIADSEVIGSRLASASSPSIPSNGKLTNMTSAIHSIKLYHIRSRVHDALGATQGKPPSREVTVGLLGQLEAWKQAIPKPQEGDKVPMQPITRFEWRYFHIVLLTLRPTILSATATDPTLNLCAMAAAEALELDRTVHKGPITRQTSVSVCHTFICGAMLLYCLQISPTVIPRRLSSRAIRACSGTLAIYSQLFHDAIPFYELFEHMTDEIMSDPAPGDARNKTINAIAAMLRGNYEELAALYDSLQSGKKPTNPSSSVHPANQTFVPQIPTTNANSNNVYALPGHSQSQSTGLTPFFTNASPIPTGIATTATVGTGSGMGSNGDMTLGPFADIQNVFQMPLPFGESTLAWEDMSGGMWQF